MKRGELDRMTPPVVGRIWLLGAMVLVVAPHLLRIPAWLAAGCALALGWRGLHDLRGHALPRRWIMVGLSLAGLAATVLVYRTLLGREPGAALLTVLLCLKMLELRTLRDAHVTLFVAYFLVATGFLFSQSILMGGYLLGVVVLLTAALVALSHPQASRSLGRYYLKTGGGLLLQALPLMLLLFVLFPRIPGPLWSLPDDGETARTGLAGDMTFGSVGNLADSNEVAFRVQFEGEIPDADRLYWRGPVLWLTDGRRWEDFPEQDRRRKNLGTAGYQSQSAPVRYTVTLEPHGRHWLFALDLPKELPEKAAVRGDFQISADEKVTELRRYTISSHLDYVTAEPSPEGLFAALQLPGNNPRTTALANQWAVETGSDVELVNRALDFFRQEAFVYTRQPPVLRGVDPVDTFLFDTRRGFCEHYAAGFTLLMRAAGVPARVVTGYQGGERNPLGDYLIVRQANAHAWSEVYLEDRGWVRVDPTAVVPVERVESLRDSERFNTTAPLVLNGARADWLARNWHRLVDGWDAINHGWNQWVLGFDQKRQRELLRRLGLEAMQWQGMVATLFTLLAIAFAAVALYLLRPLQRREPVVRLYERFCAKLARRGLARGPGEGPMDYARRVAARRPDLARPVGRIIRLYTRIRYGGSTTGAWLPLLKREVGRFRP